MALTWWHSPAKLNLFLHIIGRRDDGYHTLQSLFQMLDFGDELAFEESDTISLAQSIENVNDEDNLVIRAAHLLRSHTGVKKGCRVHLKKRLPMGGGIGGGSSNAATTLLVLNQLWKTKLPCSELKHLGLQLGADVPVFIHGQTTFAEGVGEVFTQVVNEAKWYLVVHPKVHVSTQTIFSQPELPRNSAKINATDYNFDNTRNDCQQIVCKQYSQVANLLHWLLQFAPSRMTGTGACVFARFDTKNEAETVLAQLPDKWCGFIAKGVQQSPLLQQLEAREFNAN